jgi:hypothetical protein
MDISNADMANISGNGTPASYDVSTDGYYSANQDTATALDNGTLVNTATGALAGSAPTAGTLTPPANGASYTPPGWLSGLTGLGSSLGNLVTQATGIINGKPATGPGTSGNTPAAGATVSVGGLSLSTPMLLIGAAIVGFILLKKK